MPAFSTPYDPPIPATDIHDGSVSNAEFGYLNGVTSAIQTQIDGKAATSHGHAISNVTGLQSALDGKSSTSHDHSGVYEAAGAVSTHAAVTSGVHGITPFAATILDDADAAAVRGTIGVYSTDTVDSIADQMQPLDATLTALSGWSWSSGREVPSFTAADTLSVLRVGTSANDLVQLTSDGKLPAVDGSLLTGISGGGGASAIDDLSDVTITAAASGDFLRHNGTAWVDATISASDIPSGVDATKIGGGAVSNTEFSYLDGVTSAIQTQLNAKATKDVCDTVASDTSVNGTNGSWTTLSDLTVTVPVGKNAIDALVNIRLPSSGVSTQGRFIITAGTINEADGAPVGIFFPHGVASTAMVYTSATGVISGGVRSSDTTSVVFSAHLALEVTSEVTLSFQYLTGTATANQLVFQSTSNIRAQLLA